ncbi:uncharacterized protein LY79DRAFT_199003 [Colletotrichum navitas]|uniref:Uncharacterized protein n=1 Tax=Colletotrichum navitas TaxID=681940 RepID=A0AAD8PZ15_9PEZI|nr:uncharacterized protein LY79DRAFT_199003 [Colletotrichum navitas]KAK1590744.1 hypothetical protein LY79DRAFT_199003 [Colletotrichum navitas]
MPPKRNEEATRARTAAARAASLAKRKQQRGGKQGGGGPSDPPGDQPVAPPSPSALACGRQVFEESLRRDTQAQAKIAAKCPSEDKEEDKGKKKVAQDRTPEPALKRVECMRCLASALHGDSSGWCEPAVGSRSRKCKRCAIGKVPCVTILEGSELRRLAGEFLAAKRGNSAPSILSRATSALRSRIAFEASLPHGDPRVGTQRSDEVASVTLNPQAPPQGVFGGGSAANTSVSAAASVAVANEGQAAAIRSAIDALVGGSLPAGQLPAYQVLMDQYTALMRGSRC